MCSLYSINNSSKFAGQTSFQVVLCAKDNYHLALSSGCSSSPSIPSSLSPSSCPQYSATPSSRRNSGKRARTKTKEAIPVLLVSPSSTSHSSPPEPPSIATYARIHSPPHQGSWRSNNQQARRKQSIINQDHWLHFHQHQHSQEYNRRGRTPSCSPPPTRTYAHPHSERKSPSSSPRASSTVRPLAWSSLFPSSSSPSSPCPPSSTSSPGNSGCVPVLTSFHPSPTPSSPRYSTVVQSNRLQIPAEMVIAMDSTTSKMDTDLSPVSAPSGSESNDNDAFDGDEMMLLPPPSTSLVPSCTVPVSVPDNPDANTLASPSKHLPLEDDAVAMDRRSRRKRTIQRLQAKNRTLKLSLAQAKADLAAERQQRAVIDQIYLKIKQDLNQKLETEEIKNANLKADLEQINQDMKELKDRTSPSGIGSYFSSSLSSRPSLGGPGSGSSGYKIGYDSSAYCASLSGGISSVGIHSSNMSLINGQDDSEEFLSSHAYSPSTSRGRSLSYSNSSLLQTVKESESEDEDMISEDGGDEHKDAVVSLSTSKGQSSLSTLMETDGEEESEDDDYGDSSDDEYSEDEADNGDAPRTMMEILLQRQKSSSPEDDVQDQPADADETYESMAQKCLRHAIRSRFTAAQTHLQLDELVIKYNPRPEQTMSAISHELVRWWETERISTGGPATIGGIFGNGPIVMKETGEQVVPKVAVEIRFQRFFAPLLLHYVASHAEQKALLDVLGHEVRTQGQQDAKLLRNHNGQLMALYKFDVVEAEAIVEWWQALELPANVFSSSDNLRSLNSRFVAWLEDEEDDSDDENTEDDSDYVDDEDEEDSEDDSDVASSDDDEADEATFDAQIQKEALDLQKDLTLVEQIVSAGALDQSSRAEDEDKDDVVPDPQQYLQDRKRRISFCASNVYYNQKGRMRTGPAYFPGGDDILDTGDSVMDVSGDPSTTSRPRKTYQQCPPFIPQLSDEEDEVENESDESTDGFIA